MTNLCAGLVQQNDTSGMCRDTNGVNSESRLPTLQPNIEDSIDNGGSSSKQRKPTQQPNI